MKTIKLYIVTLATLLLMPAATAWAQNVAKIGTTEYATLSLAVQNAADGATIEVIANVTELENGSELTIDKSLTITGATDTNGEPLYTISGKSDATGYNDIFITGSGTVTLSNLKIQGFGNNAATNMGHAPIYVSTNFTGTVNLENLHVSDFNRGGIFLYGGNFNVTGCDIDCANSTSGAFTKGIEIKGTATGTIQDTDIYNMERSSTAYSSGGIEIYGSGEITVDNCTISSNVGSHSTTQSTYGIVIGKVGVHDPAGGTLNIQDCTIDTGNASLSVDGSNYTATVDDCTFTNSIATWADQSSITINSGRYAENVYADAGTITIHGGNFTNFAPDTGTNGSIVIDGGTFDTEVPVQYCADNYEPVEISTGVYSVQHIKVAEVYASNGDLIDQYTSFVDAWTVANANAGSTLKMLEPDDVTSQLEASGTFTLDFNGNQLQYIGTSILNSGVILVLRGAHLTLEDTNFDPADPETVGGIVSDVISYNIDPNDPNPIITVDDIHEWYGDVKYAYAAIALTKNGETSTDDAVLTVNGGELYGHYYGIVGNGSRHGTVITVNGGTITGAEGSAIYHPQNGTLTITDGTFTGKETGIELRSGTLNVTGGTFETTSTEYSCNPNGSGTTTVGAAIAIAQHTTNQPINATISGGTFTIPSTGNAVKLSVSNPENNTFSNVSVSGLTALIGESNKIPDGYMWVEANGISTLTKAVAKIGDVNYATLQAAINAAVTASIAASGEEIIVELLKDVTDGTGLALFNDAKGDYPAANGANVKIDFGGHTYTVVGPAIGSTNTQNQVLHFEEGNTITLTNGTINMTTDVTVLADFQIFMQNYGTLTIDDMTIDGTGIAVAHYGNSFTGDWAVFNGTEKPQFNYNTAGSSVIRNSTITMVGALSIDNSAELTIEDDAVINVSAIATKGTDDRYASATPTITVENGAQFTLSQDGAAAFEALLNTKGQTLGEPDTNGVYTVAAGAPVASITVSGNTTNYPTLEAAIAAVGNGQQIDLLANVTLSSDAVCTLTDGQSFQLNLGNYTVTRGDYRVKLDKGVMAKTSKEAGIFAIKDGVTDAKIVEGVAHAQTGHYVYYAATTMTGVAYINQQGNATTTSSNSPVIVIDSRMDAMQTLEGGGWFVVNSNVTLTNLTQISRSADFILADGKTLTLGNGTEDVSFSCDLSVTFYGQTAQTGKLVLGRPLTVPYGLTQYGGKIDVINNFNGYISCSNQNDRVSIYNGEMNLVSSYVGDPNSPQPILRSVGINIYGGIVKVRSTGDNGIAMEAGDINIAGGQVEAIAEGSGGKGMVETSGSTILLWLRDPAQYPDDYVKATNYNGTVKIANGRTLYDINDNNTAYEGSNTALTDEQKAAIAGHTLRASATMSINDPSIKVTVEPATYTGAAITPVVTVKHGDNTLTKDTDYEISFDGTYTNAKTYSNAITITGKGGYYTGTRKADFVISPRSINDVTVTGNTQAYTGTAYTADEIKAPIELKFTTTTGSTETTTTLQVGDEYTISVADGTYQDPGTYQGVITLSAVEGEGKNYVGSRTVDFIIQDAINIADCDIIATTVYNGQEQTPAATVVVKSGGTVVASTNYTITYDGTPNFTNVGTTQITVTGTGNSYFGSKVVDYVISPKDISGCTVNNKTNFTGEVINPATVVTVTDGSTTLSSTNDYTLTVSQGYTYQDPQTYTGALTITGKGNYTGTVYKDFIIESSTAKPLAGHVIVLSKQTYTGANLAPTSATTTVTYDGTPLTAGTDYTFSYVTDNNTVYKDAKIYSNAIVITGKGTTYYGTVTANYVIEPRDLSDTGIEVTTTPLNYSGRAQAVTVVVKYKESATANGNVIPVENYTYTPNQLTEAGEYTVTVTAVENSNLVGTTTVKQVVKKSLSEGDYTGDFTVEPDPIPTQTYTGQEIRPAIVVKDKDRVMTPDVDYTVTYANNTAVSNENTKATVTITGTGTAYSGTITKEFTIVEEYFTVGDITYHHGHEGEEVSVGKKENDANVLATTITGTVNVPETVEYLGKTFTVTAVEEKAFSSNEITGLVLPKDIAAVENNAFKDASNLRYIDLSTAAGFTPSSLLRNIEASPFNGVPKQALVYLNGTTFTGENYVYKPGTEEKYYCEVFKIYDDMGGDQTGFTETNGYQWAFENVHPFRAYTLTNTRQLLAERHYTTCLPYALPIPNNVKAYTLEATSDKLFGFREVTGTLEAFKPYVLIPTASGQLLSSTNIDVPVFTATGTAAVELNPTTTTGSNSYAMYGTMRYMEGNDATGKYIMQYNNGNPTWKQITEAAAGFEASNKACILPMRAYIINGTPSPSRERMGVGFTNLDGSTTIYDLDDLMFDGEDSVYDLQGRKRQNVQRGGLYIKNGKKVVVKTK